MNSAEFLRTERRLREEGLLHGSAILRADGSTEFPGPIDGLRRAADRLEHDGWVQGACKDDDARCASQALCEETMQWPGAYRQAMDLVEAWLRARGQERRGLVMFNDAKGRTVEEVCELMREVTRLG